MARTWQASGSRRPRGLVLASKSCRAAATAAGSTAVIRVTVAASNPSTIEQILGRHQCDGATGNDQEHALGARRPDGVRAPEKIAVAAAECVHGDEPEADFVADGDRLSRPGGGDAGRDD